MAPCLSKFPSVCLEAVFKHVPLVDLFYSVGLVCTSWHKSRRTELLRRRRLGLIDCEEHDHETLSDYRAYDCSYGTELIERVRRDDGSPWHTLESLEKYKFNCLSVPGGVLAVPFIASLTDNFINITRLHLNLTRTTSVLTQLIRLIEHYSQHLVELKFGSGFYPESDDDDDDEDATRELALNVTNLFDCINRLQSLRHLNLRLYPLRSRPPLLSCLTRLATFSVYAFGPYFIDDWICASIKQYAKNVTSIQIDSMMDMRSMLQFNAQLANKFAVLSVGFGDFDDDDDGDHQDFDRMPTMNLFCSRFSCLIKLVLYSISDPMTKLARYLSLLTQLVHLELYFDHIPPVQPEEGEGEDDGQAQQQFTQVSSVRLLSLDYPTESHHDFERLFIPEIFPNVQVLRLEYYLSNPKCTVCGISSADFKFDSGPREHVLDRLEVTNPELVRRVAECTRQKFGRCANLHTVAIVYLGKQILINVDQL